MTSVRDELIRDLPFANRFISAINNHFGRNGLGRYPTYSDLEKLTDAEILRILDVGRTSLDEWNLFKASKNPIKEFGRTYDKQKYLKRMAINRIPKEIRAIKKQLSHLIDRIEEFESVFYQIDFEYGDD